MMLVPLLLAAMLGLAVVSGQTYKAAVYEHIRQVGWHKVTWDKFVSENLRVYDQVLDTAAAQNVDIIVFPEYGIIPTSKPRGVLLKKVETVPPPGLNPCVENHGGATSIVRRLSCLARNHGIVVVANTASKQPCDPQEDPWCPSHGNAYIFNTNVVLGRDGKLIARHFKNHLFLEPGFDEPPSSLKTVSIFETDFGTFGTFICFDIVHPEAAELVEKYNITNVAYPTWWYDEKPGHQAVQHHMAWARRFQVNLLSSNVHYPYSGSLGSGIFSGVRGNLISTHAIDGLARLLIANVPRDPRNVKNNTRFSTKELIIEKNDTAIYKRYSWNNADLENCTVVRLEKDADTLEACNNFHCCGLQYKAANQLNDSFVLVAFNGFRVIARKYQKWEQSCLVAVVDKTRSKVRFPLKSHTAFEELAIWGNFSTPYVFPSVMQSGHTPANVSFWETPNLGKIAYRDPHKSSPVLNAVLFGRDYGKDPEPTH